MYAKKEKRGIWKVVAIFFAAMIVFTLLSRVVYQRGTAVVKTAVPKPGTISHTVRLTGKTEENQVLAVTTVAGLRVGSVAVHEGQQVEQGQVLFTLDMGYLEETIVRQEQEMRKQQLTVQDAWSQNAASQSQKNNQQAQAQENYNTAVTQAQTQLARAERDLERAKKALEGFQNGQDQGKAEEQALMAAVDQAEQACANAQNALDQLHRQMEEEIRQAQEEAMRPKPVETQPPETTVPTVPEGTTETGESQPLENLPQMAAATPQELEAIAQEIRNRYQGQILEAQRQVEAAQAVLKQAKQELDAFRQEQLAPPKSEEELKAAVEQAQEARDDALAALENAKITYGRAIESANLPDGSNHSAQIGQITYDQMQLQLEKLEALRQAGGEILAPVDGIVTSTQVQTGQMTADTTAMLLADMSQGSRFTGQVSQEQCPYIGVGDPVTLRATGNGKEYRDLSVTTFTQQEDGTGRITVQLPAGSLPLGASAQLQATRKSQGYGCCVPLTALHLDAKNQPYVLVAEPVDTVLGRQMQARKVNVTVLEKNETTAALAEGAVAAQDQVIISADRAVDARSRIRVVK